MFISKILCPSLQMESWARCLSCIFSCSRGNCIFFFNFLFDIFWNSISLAYVCITAWSIGFGLRLSVYLSTRVSLCSRYGFFCCTFTYFVPFGVIENRVTKINFKYFNGNCDYSSNPGWSILFLYAPAHKGLAFRKNYL